MPYEISTHVGEAGGIKSLIFRCKIHRYESSSSKVFQAAPDLFPSISDAAKEFERRNGSTRALAQPPVIGPSGLPKKGQRKYAERTLYRAGICHEQAEHCGRRVVNFPPQFSTVHAHVAAMLFCAEVHDGLYFILPDFNAIFAYAVASSISFWNTMPR